MGDGSTGHRLDIVSTAEGDFVVSPSAEGEPAGHVPDSAGVGTPRHGASQRGGVASSESNRSGGTPSHNAKQGGNAASRRPWIGIHFECCDVYQRVYRKPDDDRYLGFCPKCGRQIRLRVGAEGVNAKFFRATPG